MLEPDVNDNNKFYRDELAEFNHLVCKTGVEYHFLRNPRKVICGSVVCLDCYEAHQTSCKKCPEVRKHDLREDKAFVDNINQIIKDNAVEITKKIIQYLEKTNDTITDQQLQNLCGDINYQIEENVESAKSQVENLHQELKEQLKEIEVTVSKDLKRINEETEKKTKEYGAFANDLDERFKNTNNVTVDDIYKCQDHIEELKRLDENFHKVLRKVLFEPSDWTPDASYIAPIKLPQLSQN